MDVRGVEVTNQLRSAIRAKLLELGVRYDEELPDYILVMVVNKKSRQQMHEDLHLFLENSTTPFVDWLHDQVLKKLQKVTIAKKKPTREFVPTVVVKQEEERKKKKNSSIEQIKVKKELTPEKSVNKVPQSKIKQTSNVIGQQQNEEKNVSDNDQTGIIAPLTEAKIPDAPEEILPKQPIRAEKSIESEIVNVKRTLDKDEMTPTRSEKRMKTIEPSKEINQPEETDIGERRLKSCVNKPKITSVVSVKTRLGITSPRNKFELHRDRIDIDHRRQIDKRGERHLYEPINRRDHFRERNNEDETAKRNKDELKNRQNSTIINNKTARVIGANESNGKSIGFSSKRPDNLSIKDRLGVNNKLKQKEIVEDNQRNIKNRLGPVKSKFIALGRLGPSSINKSARSNIRNNAFEEEEEDVELDEETSVGPVKSHIIAVNNITVEKLERRNARLSKRLIGDKSDGNAKANNDDNGEDDDNKDEGKIIASKVTVTPRPLKPLQPIQKRATQSLLLRAVAEANQSVVKQKNPEPILLENKMALKRLRPASMRSASQNLAVCFNANKRLVMEKIQVELTTSNTMENNEPEPYNSSLFTDADVPRSVTDEQMGVVMSLFQRGDDNQKFLVTLNGYNNNVNKEKNYSEDDDERLVMEVNDEDELLLTNTRNETFVDNELSMEPDEMENLDKSEIFESNEIRCNEQNVKIMEDDMEEMRMELKETEEEEELVRKRRKLSPIIYTRSPTPDNKKSSLISQLISPIDKRTINTPIQNDKARDKCRYWPTCTLGNKCAYLHPKVPCSAFPACKFGDKCAYKHPKCKFGLSCTKVGCVFSHPSQQCKYHPFCTKPGCVYLHPPTHSPTIPVETVRGKFTWRRRD
ncbi:hypothetical protein PV327_005872 [Microctonus hyperodae]|uniref:Zinc finger CCCH domain-containing protein 14 n=1 Tax=Microctonus hyperodae TaxID=165561 RepID=A0AA39L0A6_MICHY|nr:hypothetical protein PV327_005872 [Microctonus hyperodae]